MTKKTEPFHFDEGERKTFAEEFSEKRRIARLAEMKILSCPEFAGCLTDRETAVLKFWSEDLPERELLDLLRQQGNEIGRDTLYRDIKNGVAKLRTRLRRLRTSQISEDLRWILALVSAREDGWDIVWGEQIQEKDYAAYLEGLHV